MDADEVHFADNDPEIFATIQLIVGVVRVALNCTGGHMSIPNSLLLHRLLTIIDNIAGIIVAGFA